MPDGPYELKGFAEDNNNGVVLAFAVFHGTHNAAVGSVEPTGKSVAATTRTPLGLVVKRSRT